MWQRALLIVSVVVFVLGLTYVAFRPSPENESREPVVIGFHHSGADEAEAAVEPASIVATLPPGDSTLNHERSISAEQERTAGRGAVAASSAAPSAATAQSYARGELLFRNARYAEAAEELRSAAQSDTGSFRAHYMLGLALWKGGEPMAASTALHRALSIKPEDHRAIVNLARVELELEDPQAALALLEPEVGRRPDADDSWNVLGRACFVLGRDDAAIEAYRRAVELNASNGYAWNNLGLVYLTLGRDAEAVEPLMKAVALVPEMSVAQNNLGIVLERTGRLEEARGAFAKAAEAGHRTAGESLARVTARLEAEAPSMAGTDSTRVSAR